MAARKPKPKMTLELLLQYFEQTDDDTIDKLKTYTVKKGFMVRWTDGFDFTLIEQIVLKYNGKLHSVWDDVDMTSLTIRHLTSSNIEILQVIWPPKE